MKHIIITVLAIFIMAFGACEFGIESNDSFLIKPVEGIRMTYFGNANGTTGTNTTVVTPGHTVQVQRQTTMVGSAQARRYLFIDILPESALFGFTWESSDPETVTYDLSTFQIVGWKAGPAKLTFTSKGRMANGEHAVAECDVNISM